jgi:hypothetical protein
MMTPGEALNFLFTILSNAAGIMFGFLSAWGLFVLQENRKQSFAVQSARQSLIAELKWLESNLSMTVLRCAVQSDIVLEAQRLGFVLDFIEEPASCSHPHFRLFCGPPVPIFHRAVFQPPLGELKCRDPT